MTRDEVCQIIQRMIDSGEPDSVYIPLPIIHEFDDMVLKDGGPSVVTLFGEDVVREAGRDVSFEGKVDFILIGYMFDLVNGCTYNETGLHLGLEQAKLFVKMLANPELACIAQRYIIGSSLEEDVTAVQEWKGKLP